MKRKIKQAGTLALASMMALSMTACGNSNTTISTSVAAATTAASAQTDAAQEQITLRFCWWGGDTRHEATEKAVAAFMEKYPYITVENEYGAWNGWEESQSLKIMGGSAPDVMQINWNWIKSYSNNGTNFYDLNELSDTIDLSQFPQSSLDACMMGGHLEAIPVALTGRLFYWNKTSFDEAGAALPSDEASLFEAGTKFAEHDSDSYPLAMSEYDRMIFLVHYLESKYNKPWVQDDKVQYSVDEIKEGLELINLNYSRRYKRNIHRPNLCLQPFALIDFARYSLKKGILHPSFKNQSILRLSMCAD